MVFLVKTAKTAQKTSWDFSEMSKMTKIWYFPKNYRFIWLESPLLAAWPGKNHQIRENTTNPGKHHKSGKTTTNPGSG